MPEATTHGPGFDRKIDGRHLSAQKEITRFMYEKMLEGKWTTHEEHAEELTRCVPGPAFNTASAGARMRALRGDPAEHKGGRGWTIPRRRRKGARAMEYLVDQIEGETCIACEGQGCDECDGKGHRRVIQAPDGAGPSKDDGGQTMLGNWADTTAPHQKGFVR